MSIVERTATRNAAVEEAELAPLTPEELVDQLRVLRRRIPQFLQLPNDRQLRQIRRNVSMNVEFANEAFSAVGASEVVQSALGNTPDELYQAEDEVARWSTAESEMRSLLRGVSLANLVRRHRLYQAALQAYNISKQLARHEDHANLLPYVESMSRIRKAARRRRTTAAPEPEPATLP